MSRRYPPTLLRVGVYSAEGYAKVDVRHPLIPVKMEELRGVRLEPPWAVMAIELPPPEVRDPERERALFHEVWDGPFPCDGATLSDSQETYDVHGVAVAMPFEDAIDLAWRYDAGFLFWFDGTAFWYVPVPESVGPSVRLPVPVTDWPPRQVQGLRLEGMRDPLEEDIPPGLRRFPEL